MITIGVKGLAQFIVAGPARQRKVLKDYKYPSPEGQAQAKFYRDAHSAVREYHKSKRSQSWLLARAQRLDNEAVAAHGKTKMRLKSNARAIREYASAFANRTFTIKPRQGLELTLYGVRVVAEPTLLVRERNRDKLLRIEFAKNLKDTKLFRIMNQFALDAASAVGLTVKSSDVECLHTPTAICHKGARRSSRLSTEIDAACQNIATLWPSI